MRGSEQRRERATLRIFGEHERATEQVRRNYTKWATFCFIRELINLIISPILTGIGEIIKLINVDLRSKSTDNAASPTRPHFSRAV